MSGLEIGLVVGGWLALSCAFGYLVSRLTRTSEYERQALELQEAMVSLQAAIAGALEPVLRRLGEEIASKLARLEAEAVLCPRCGWDASFQPPEIKSCTRCGAELEL